MPKQDSETAGTASKKTHSHRPKPNEYLQRPYNRTRNQQKHAVIKKTKAVNPAGIQQPIQEEEQKEAITTSNEQANKVLPKPNNITAEKLQDISKDTNVKSSPLTTVDDENDVKTNGVLVSAVYQQRTQKKKPLKAMKRPQPQPVFSVNTPIICFPYRWKDPDVDEKCINNKQYHRKEEELPNIMSKEACVKHLLSYQNCCKRFLCAYFLNLKQLHSCDGLLNEMMASLNDLICTVVYDHPNLSVHTKFIRQRRHRIQTDSVYYDSELVCHRECSSCTFVLYSPQELGEEKTTEMKSDVMDTTTIALQSVGIRPFQHADATTSQYTPSTTAFSEHAITLSQFLHKSDGKDNNNNNNDNNNNNNNNNNGNESDEIDSDCSSDNKSHCNSKKTKEIKVKIKDTPRTRCNSIDSIKDDIASRDESSMQKVETQSCPDLQCDGFSLDSDLQDTPAQMALPNDHDHAHFSSSELQTNRDSFDPCQAIKHHIGIYYYIRTCLCVAFCCQTSFVVTSQLTVCLHSLIMYFEELLYHWIHYYPSDFSDEMLLQTLMRFIETCKERTKALKPLKRRWTRLTELIRRRKPRMKENMLCTCSISNLRINPKVAVTDHNVTQYRFTDSFFPPPELVSHLTSKIDLLQVQPATVAEQLTLIDTDIFLRIEIRELTNCAWQNCEHLDSDILPNDSNKNSPPIPIPEEETLEGILEPKPLSHDDSNMAPLSHTSESVPDTNGADSSNEPRADPAMVNETQRHTSWMHKLKNVKIDAPNLLYMIDHVNRLSLWVATAILQEKTIAQQVAMCKFFYFVAHHCLQLNNIHSCTAIFAGICLEPVDRLKHVKALLLQDSVIQMYHCGFMCLFSSEKNYRYYRNIVEQWFESEQIHTSVAYAFVRNICSLVHSIRPCLPFMPVLVKDLFVVQTNLMSKNPQTYEKEVNLRMLEKNCRLIRRFYEMQQRSKLYANSISKDVDAQSIIRMSVACHKHLDTLRLISLEIQPKIIKT
ncbi:hypothetical protein RFI_06930 [Reticulomyxa filosa]|uniref:Ras-GEF domain-containing protein n=1 Tax=Reticulomyxa filosa TaxID=46433 RepID=X6NWI3_RETFI|nr:hypothetical protein RFI_06930 [Reticulomyxa filosa]|eukprot:ETO30189.1 hypothetical protein RFI_06930 [Reticulomyxa filosa]